jgi:hypothetical protein
MANSVPGQRTLFMLLVFFLGLLCLHFIVTPVGEVRAQGEPVIQHSALECLPNDQHAICSAVITPSADIQTARVYFRSNKYPDFYYVEMTGNGDDFEAVLPIPSEETSEVVYYVEAVTRTYNMGRSAENGVQVTSASECRRRDEAALWWTGGEPGIIVGATVEGASALPPGFQAAGIAGFVSAVGAASSVGGGIGTGAVVGIAAGAAGAVGVGVAVGGSDDETTTTTAIAGGGGSTTTTTGPATTTSVTSGNEPPVACFTTDPANGEITVGDSIRLDARCSEGDPGGGDAISNYEWDLGDGRSRSGPDLNFITPRYNTAGTFTITLTVTDSGGSSSRVVFGLAQAGSLQDSESKEITVLETPISACFSVSTPTPGFYPVCDMRFDASCSTGPITRYDWVLDVGNVISRVTRSGRVVTHTWGFACSGGEVIGVTLTVTGDDGQTDVASQQVTTIYLTSPFADKTFSSTFSSYLSVAPFDGSVRGQVMINSMRMFQTDSSTPFVHHVDAKAGENTVESFTTTPMDKPGSWRFDFADADGFVPGSIKVQSGKVIAINPNFVVFRLSGTPGERIKFTYKLLP